MSAHDPADDDANWDYDDDEFDPYGDCAMMPDGLCGKAGSEECDFECPIMFEIIRKEALKRMAKKKAKNK